MIFKEQPKEAGYAFFSNAHGSFSKIDHMVGHKTSLNKLKKIEITPSIFSDYNGLKLETNLKEKTKKHSNTWRRNNMLLNNDELTMRSRKSKSIWKQVKINTTQKLWDKMKAVLSGKFIGIQTYLKNREKSQIHNLTLHQKEPEEQQ